MLLPQTESRGSYGVDGSRLRKERLGRRRGDGANGSAAEEKPALPYQYHDPNYRRGDSYILGIWVKLANVDALLKVGIP